MYMQITESQALQNSRVEMDPDGQPIIAGDYSLLSPYGNGVEGVYPQMVGWASKANTKVVRKLIIVPQAALHSPEITLRPRTRGDSPLIPGGVNKPRVRKAAKKKNRVSKHLNNHDHVVDRPLSELTRDMKIPVRDMEAHVMRSSEQRRKEVENKKGKVSRPMNSFILYRAAYAERTKGWICQNNHQVVSQISGSSWSLEPKEIREYYERLAIIDRENHDKAHPTYKFAPNKRTNTRKKRNISSLKEEDNSDINDLGMGPYPKTVKHMSGGSFHGSSFQSRTPTPLDRDSSYDSRQGTPFEQNGDMYANSDMNRSSWEMSNPGRPLPGMISPPEQTHYYQPSIHQSMLGPNIEDVTFKKMGVPGIPYDGQGALAGLPGNAHPDLLQQQLLPQTGSPASLNDMQVDPQLMEFESPHGLPYNDRASYHVQLDMWHMPNGQQQHVSPSLSSQEDERYQQQYAFHPSIQQSMDGRDMWNESQIETGSQFEDWIGSGASFECGGNGQQKHL
ncbi:hypothetical protein GX48_05064 [Paracoccidioides brasiliensis]|nr:hypothetical protein GX48_05064 [Paracoccidioides brasiliensis]